MYSEPKEMPKLAGHIALIISPIKILVLASSAFIVQIIHILNKSHGAYLATPMDTF